MAANNMSVLLDFNDETTTGGDRSLLSEETHSPYVRKVNNKVIDLQTSGFLLCELKINSPSGMLDIKIRELDHLHLFTIVELIYNLGEFKLIEMKEALFTYLEDQIQKAITLRF